MSLERFLLPLRKLTEDGVSFVVIGGLAVVLHGHMRLTMDLDLVISLDDNNTKMLVNSLKLLGYVPRIPATLDDFSNPSIRNEWITQKNMKALNLWRPPDPFSALDLVIENPVSFEDLLKDSVSMIIEDVSINVASIPHLIKMKELAGRDTDKGDIIALKELFNKSNERKNKKG